MEFWKSAGFHLVERNAAGRLVVTDDLLRAYLTRPEIHPIEESCPTEHQIFEKLMENPRQAIDDGELAAIVDRDTAANYSILLGFRDHLLAHDSLEAAYLDFFRKGNITIPPVFLDQIAHLLLRNILTDVTDPMQLRTAELFFREQVVTTADGTLMLADEEIVEMRSKADNLGGLGQLLVESGTPAKQISLDVIDDDNKHIYWERSDQFDTAIDFRFTQPAPDAFARVIEKWIEHFFAIKTRVQARQSIRDERWSWHIGCDANASAILNGLYNGEDVPQASLERIVGLFRLEFIESNDVIDSMQGKPVYLGLAMNEKGRLKMKPQNLLTNLPVKAN